MPNLTINYLLIEPIVKIFCNKNLNLNWDNNSPRLIKDINRINDINTLLVL